MSFILSNVITKKIPQWNKTIIDDDELLKLCTQFNARHVEEENRKGKGEYIIYKGVSFILVKKELKREMKLWVGLHEFGHHLLHYPCKHKFSKGAYRRMDREANFFAAIALIPTWLVESKTYGEIMEEYNYPKELIDIRKEIYDTYTI